MNEERYFTDNNKNIYLITMENDEISNFEDVYPGISIYFGKNRNFRNIYNDDEVNSLIDSFYKDKVFNSREELEETTKQMVEKLHKKGIAILPFGKHEHGGVSLMPFGERCQDWKWEGTDLAGFAYITKDKLKNFYGNASIERVEEDLKKSLKTFNALSNGELYTLTLYKVVPDGEKYDSYSMDTKGENRILCYNEDLGSKCGYDLGNDFNWDVEKAMNDLIWCFCFCDMDCNNVKLYSSLEDLKKENNLKINKGEEK